MKKLVLIITSIFILVLSLSSCSNDLITILSGCYFYNAGLDNSSTYVFDMDKKEINELIDYAKNYNYSEEDSDYSTFFTEDNDKKIAGLNAVVGINKFDIYVLINPIPNNVSSIKIEVDNDIKINDNELNANKEYDINVEGTKVYFVLSIDIKENTTIKILSLTDDNGKVYKIGNTAFGITRFNEIELLTSFDLITMADDFNSFKINASSNCEITNIRYRGEDHKEIDNNYQLLDNDGYYIKYIYKIKNVEFKCEKMYIKNNGSLFYNGSIIHEY